MAEVPELPADPTNRVADDVRAAELGHLLFFDTRLSGNDAVSCATCHDPARDFTDGRRVAQGIGENTRNAPTVLNAAYHRWLTWDGRADSLWAQALEPMENDIEMGGDRIAIVRTIAGDPDLRARYEELFGSLPDLSGESMPEHARPRRDDATDAWSESWEQIEPEQRAEVTTAFVNIGKSIGAYQRRLVSMDSPFDRFVASAESGTYVPVVDFPDGAVRGLALFVGDAGCWECHAGPMLTTAEFHDIGVPPVAGGMPTDAGRFAGADVVKNDPFNAAGVYSDASDGTQARLVRSLLNSPDNWGRFRTPSLREVSRTAPYMHEGRFDSLAEVVRYYSTLEGAVQLDHHQETVLAPLELDELEQADLVEFLESLDGMPVESEMVEKPPVRTRGG
jgi:cytochrome c peroxidase